MKNSILMKRIIPIILAVLMVSGILLSVLPVRSYAQTFSNAVLGIPIDMIAVSGYPTITFYGVENKEPEPEQEDPKPVDDKEPVPDVPPKKPIPDLENIPLNDPKLSFNTESVSYAGLYDDKPVPYASIDMEFGYADKNYLADKWENGKIPNKPSNFVAYMKYGERTIEANGTVTFGRSSNGYLITKFQFKDIENLFNAENKTASIYMQYISTDDKGVQRIHKGNMEYTFRRLETAPTEPENPEGNKPGDQEWGDDTLIPVPPVDTPETDIKSSTPYIIVEAYSVGKYPQIAAGSKFNLNLTCRNTHQNLNLENIIMKVGTSDGLQLTNSSNTFYIKSLKKDSTFDKQLNISALPNAEAQSHTISVSFSYEYIADNARQKGEMSQEITIPVIQPDRFSVDPITGIKEITAGEENDVISRYVNKSRGEIYNLTATLECDDSISCEEKIQHKGNIVAGGSGDFTFSLSGTVPGTYECNVVYTYEDALANLKEIRAPFQVTFVEAPSYEWEENPGQILPPEGGQMLDEFGNPIDPNAPAALSNMQKIGIIGGIVALVVISAVIIIKKRKNKFEFEDDDENI